MSVESASKEYIQIGDEIEDGTIYAGISPDTHKPIYTTPLDELGTYTFNQAAAMANNLEAHGYRDWRAPSRGELNVLYENRNKGKLAGTFNETGSGHAGWYWSSSQQFDNGAWDQGFREGHQHVVSKDCISSLRCVR